MQAFRKYLEEQLCNPEFRDEYQDECNICKVTVGVINKIYAENLSKEEIAKKAGVDIKSLQDLESADKCYFEDVQKLCKVLGLEVPERCKKFP